ncbi:MAG: hypothetical protein ACYC77_11725 [Coriobacteriia bacterium]
MNERRWRIRLGIGLVTATVVLYAAHFAIFRDVHHIFIYLIGDIAFLPIEVLLVTMVLHALLEKRAKQQLLHKLNMVIGAFFAEAGTELLGALATFDTSLESVREDLVPTHAWTDKQFANAQADIRGHTFGIDATRGDLGALKTLVVGQRPFLLRLLENQNLLEHETFTDTLWAVFHLADELAHRELLEDLPTADLAHLSGDINRAYAALAGQWIGHLHHLKGQYPYLFSLAVRTNPLDAGARVEVTA